jgi:FkbM family methyltransferase
MNARRLKDAIRRAIRATGYDLVEFEPHLFAWELTRAMFDARRVNCVIDVGAHHGEYGLFLRHFGYTGDIVSFEPVSSNFEQLVEAADGDPRWQLHRVALGAEPGTAVMTVAKGSDLSSFLTLNDFASVSFGDRARVEREEIVEVRRLDALLPTIIEHVEEPRVFVKIDAQGFDLQVLEGAAGVLNQVCALQLELSAQPIYEGMPPMAAVLDRIEDLGFAPAGLYPITRDESLRVIEFDGMFVRRAGGERGRAPVSIADRRPGGPRFGTPPRGPRRVTHARYIRPV